MLDIKNVVISNLNGHTGMMARFVKMKSLLDAKAAANLRLLATKNNINRNADYQYLLLPVTDSTAPVNGIDYIHPVVKPVVDYASAVIAKGLMPNGEINFEFVADGEWDDEAARQATNMVSRVVNQMNDPHFILERWVMDSAMHKNGMMMIKPIREPIARYVETEGTLRREETNTGDEHEYQVEEKEATSRNSLNLNSNLNYVFDEGEKFCKQIEKAEYEERISYAPYILNYEYGVKSLEKVVIT